MTAVTEKLAADDTAAMAWITDSLRRGLAYAARFSPFDVGYQSVEPCLFSHQLALAAFMSSGLLRKVITIPAADRTQRWRDWQAESDDIGRIEAEEKRLELCAKTRFAEVLRGTGGGAMVLVTAGDHAEPLVPESIGEGGLIAVNVVSRWQIQPRDFDRDLASPTFGQPGMFMISTGRDQRLIHPSRVVAFRGEPIPQGEAVNEIDAFWGDCRLLRVFSEVQRSDDTQKWFAALVRKAKLLRIGIPGLSEYTETEAGQELLNQRLRMIAEGENILNATVFSAANGDDEPGETVSDYQVSWTGIPAVMDAFDQRVAAVSDIPFTRLMGRSPAGMNATGEHDMDNWHKAVGDGQENETRPCLERIDPLLLRSAGVRDPDSVWWRWAPLDQPTEKERAETFKVLAEAIDKVVATGLIPDVAMSRAVQNLLEERGDLPGLGKALSELSEEERFGAGEDEDDPSALQATEPAPDEPSPRVAGDARFLADASPRTLYVSRRVLNADEIIRWARAQGLETTIPAEDMHVTVAFSRRPVDWFAVGRDWSGDEDGRLRIPPGGPRAVERLGDGDAVALLFADDHLQWRHERILEIGASWDWPEYRPHITLSYDADGLDVETMEPYAGPIVLGPELFGEVNEDWMARVREE